jgi:hypothetical protein
VPIEQFAHVAPPPPQAFRAVPGSHVVPLVQQPVHPLVVLHTQVPPLHASAESQVPPPVPHEQAPLTQRSLSSPGQTERENATHWLFEQHPLGHEVAVHWQVAEAPLPTHCWLAPHAAPVPHPQAPEGKHTFEVKVLQAEHELPPAPQLGNACAVQALPEQQPAQPVVVLQTHDAPTQAWPVEQAPLAPHAHAPLVHRSAAAPQATQVAPPVPQVLVVGAWHWLPEQQPDGHEVAVHWHVAVAPVPTHCWPAPHAAPVEPQTQAPVVGSHRLDVVDEQVLHAFAAPRQVGNASGAVQLVALAQHPEQLVASHTHAPPEHRNPGPHAAPDVPQAQLPLLQRSALVVSHAVHALPFVPQS